jgi:hypothetical protein
VRQLRAKLRQTVCDRGTSAVYPFAKISDQSGRLCLHQRIQPTIQPAVGAELAACTGCQVETEVINPVKELRQGQRPR